MDKICRVLIALSLLGVVFSVPARAVVIEHQYGELDAAVSGSPTTGAGQFTMLATPKRLLDTGAANGVPTSTPVPANDTVTVTFAGRGGIPAAGVSGLLANIQVVAPKASGALPTWAAGEARPGAMALS